MPGGAGQYICETYTVCNNSLGVFVIVLDGRAHINILTENCREDRSIMVRCETCILGCCDPQIPFYIIEILRTPAPGAAHFFLQYPVSAYKIWNNGWILIFKVSKQSYWSVQHDRIICKWRHCLHSGQKLN